MSNNTLVKNYVASGAINNRRIVKFAAIDGSVSQAAAAGDFSIGVSVESIDAADTERVDIVVAGIAEVKAGGVIVRGGAVTSDATGQAVAAVATNRAIGFAMASCVAGDIVDVLIAPHVI